MAEKLGMVQHTNLVSGWEHPKEHEIYCKRDHRVKSVEISECEKCKYYRGAGHMDAITCEWEDTLAGGFYPSKTISMAKAQDELMRVSWMIDHGVLKKG